MDDDRGGTIVSSYKRYKAGTKQVINWLANTAAQYCDLRDVLDCARTGSALHTTIRVKTHELLTLAKVIAAAKQSTVPAGILEVLQDVISGRQSCAGWYASQTTEDDSEMVDRNETHLHFVSILQTVLGYLSGLKVTLGSEIEQAKTTKGKNKRKKKNAGEPTSQHNDLRNLFQYLDVEEPTESSLGQTGPPKTAAGPDYELENDQEMDFFALWCHLQDMSDTRFFLTALWLEYRRGDITIEVAGVVTEIGLGMMSRAHDDFVQTYPQFNYWRDIMDFLQLHTCFSRNVVCVVPCHARNALKRILLPETQEARPTDLLCPAAAFLLLSFSKCTEDFTPPDDLTGLFNMPLLETTIAHPETSFKSHLLSLVPVMIQLAYSPVKEEYSNTTFTDALLPLVCQSLDRGAPMSTIYCCQTIMDINHSLGSDLSCSSEALLQAAWSIQTSAERTLKYFDSQLPFRIEQKSQILRARRCAELLRKAIELTRKLDEPQRSLDPTQEELYVYFGYRTAFPTLHACPHAVGKVQYDLKLQAHIEEMQIANQCHVVVLMAHLYKAACRYGLVTAVWHDMDLLVAQHSGKKPFITKTNANATDPYAMLKHFLIDLGADASTFTYGVAPPPPTEKMLLKGKTVDASCSTLSSGLSDRYMERRKLNLDVGTYELYDGVLRTMMARSNSSSQSTKKHHFAPIQLLSTLKATMIEDEPRLNFAYSDFTIKCLEMHTKVMCAGLKAEDAADLFGQTYHRFEWSWGYVYFLLKSAGDTVAKGHSVKSSKFATCARGFQSELESMDTKEFSQAAFDASSGRIPKHRRPKYNHEDPSFERAALSERYPEITVGSTGDTLEFYDPCGSLEKFELMLEDEELRKFMPEGSEPSKISHE